MEYHNPVGVCVCVHVRVCARVYVCMCMGVRGLYKYDSHTLNTSVKFWEYEKGYK